MWVREDLWEKGQLQTRVFKDSTHSNLALEVAATEPVVRPDVLLYWVPGNPKIQDSLPNDAVLLGAWMQEPAGALELPQVAKVGQGKLILYSLADHEIVNVSKPFSIQ